MSGEYPYPQGTYSKSRVMVTSWLDTASVYLFNRMSDLNLDTVYYQDFMVSSYPVRNIVGLKKGLYSKDTCIVVGAHYDDYSNNYQIAPGADDNASGSAAVLELARVFHLSNLIMIYTLSFLQLKNGVFMVQNILFTIIFFQRTCMY